LILFLLVSISLAKDIKPHTIFKSAGFVNDFVVDGNTLHVGNDAGSVDSFDIDSAKIKNQILLPPITSSIGTLVSADVLSVDYLNGKILILSVGNNGFRNLWIYQNNELKQIINEEKKLTIKKAKFINDEQIFLGSLGSDIILYDISESYNIYNTHISDSALGDLVLSEDKSTAAIADEAGRVSIVDAKSSKLLKEYDSQNVDNIFKIAYSNGVIITAGQDRRVGVYPKNQKPYYIKSNFLVFCVALSKDGKTGLYYSDEQANLQLFDISSKENKDRLVGHSGVVNKIWFKNKNEIFSSERSSRVIYWKLNK
jgi:hypothetical protein